MKRYSSPGQLDYIQHFLCVSWFFLRNTIFDVKPPVFYWIQVQGLDWPLHHINLVGLEPRSCCSLVCLGSLSSWNSHFKAISSLSEGNMTSLSILIQTDLISCPHIDVSSLFQSSQVTSDLHWSPWSWSLAAFAILAILPSRQFFFPVFSQGFLVLVFLKSIWDHVSWLIHFLPLFMFCPPQTTF